MSGFPNLPTCPWLPACQPTAHGPELVAGMGMIDKVLLGESGASFLSMCRVGIPGTPPAMVSPRLLLSWGGAVICCCALQPPLCSGSFCLLHFRDRLTHNDIVATTYLSMSKISAPGGELEGMSHRPASRALSTLPTPPSPFQSVVGF